MDERTQTNVFADRGARASRSRVRAVLTLALRANAPLEPPSRHVLDQIDCVTFGRGPRSAMRVERDGMRCLELRIPDPIMSKAHGRLLHVGGRWHLEDQTSKNGALVDGRVTRKAALEGGNVIELGHTLFLFERLELPDDTPLDLSVPDAVAPGLATLQAALHRTAGELERVAPTDVPVLFAGETGTGKELWARAVHTLSGRSGAFVALNCGGLPAGLLEAELFGHRRGAFTGATVDRPGYLRSATGGTLFLDEVAELPLEAQSALLRALQEREVTPVGDARPIPVDFRLVAATHRSLSEMVRRSTFRQDLYARLQGLTVTLPPLRERRCDLGLIVGALLRRLPGGERARFSPEAALALLRDEWPLNIRGLERCLQTALALAGGRAVTLDDLRLAPEHPAPASPPASPRREELLQLVELHQGNLSALARALSTSRSQVRRLLARHGVDLAPLRGGANER